MRCVERRLGTSLPTLRPPRRSGTPPSQHAAPPRPRPETMLDIARGVACGIIIMHILLTFRLYSVATSPGLACKRWWEAGACDLL